MSAGHPRILLVEDNAADVRLMREALRERGIHGDLRVAGNGDGALALLQSAEQSETETAIDLVLLDLNLPGKSGLELLRELRSDDRLKTLPVVVLTTSTSELDVCEAYRLGANCYIVKPVDFEEFGRIVSAIDSFWFGVARVPSSAGPGDRSRSWN
jgi:two-component system response regulator